jgi:hypothetical protein
MTTSEALQTRVKRLEAGGGGGGGCDRCRGTLMVVSDAISGEFHSASWNGEPLDEVELDARHVETRCPKCDRRIDADETTTITVGGRREPR